VHTDDIVDIDALELLPKLAMCFDEPFGDSSALPTYRVSELAAHDVKVVLTGDGGDEAFAGYRRYLGMKYLSVVASVPAPIRAAARAATSTAATVTRRSPRTHRRLATAWDLASVSDASRYDGFMSIFDPQSAARIAGSNGTDSYVQEALEGNLDAVDRLLRADVLTYLPGDLLVKMDRATMANSLEARSPLLDHVLVDYAAKLPSSTKLGMRNGKKLLRQVAGRLLPKDVLDHPKMGFAVPIDRWFDGDLASVLLDLASSEARASFHAEAASTARQLLAEHRSFVKRHGPRLWSLLMLFVWEQQWMPAEVAA
jgi:asparagine synthase (glutamine-hydrolysing)